jgi:bilin biosynthesis protein
MPPNPAITDALLEKITEAITLLTFDAEDPELLQQLVESFADEREAVRRQIVETFGEIGEPATPILLQAVAQHPNPLVRRSCSKALAKIADPDAVPLLRQVLLYDPDTEAKSLAAGALARTGVAAVEALLEVIESPECDESTKGYAAWALAFIGPEAAGYLAAAIASDSVDVRCAAVGAIAHLVQDQGDQRGDPKAFDLLIAALTDPAESVRATAAAAFGKLKKPGAVPHLILALRDSAGTVRQTAAISLGKLGDRLAIAPLQLVLNDELESVRLLAKLALSQLAPPINAPDSPSISQIDDS